MAEKKRRGRPKASSLEGKDALLRQAHESLVTLAGAVGTFRYPEMLHKAVVLSEAMAQARWTIERLDVVTGVVPGKEG